MEYDKDKVDDTLLALMWLTIFDDQDMGTRSWKGYAWDHLDRLHEKGYIGNPKNKNKSVPVTEKGEKRAQELFEQLFGENGQSAG